jgi:hypothetical protein
MKKTITVILILALILALAFFLLKGDIKLVKNSSSDELIPEEEDNLNLENKSKTNTSLDIGSGGSGSGGGGGSVSSSTGDSSIDLPEDIAVVDCGLYFQEYGVCTGRCPKGICVSEGRSCYCQTN